MQHACANCGLTFEVPRPAKYCSKLCFQAALVQHAACSIAGCQRPHRAKGYCSKHYNDTFVARQVFVINCETCGARYVTTRPDGRFCSPLCVNLSRHPTSCVVPDTHPSRSTPVPRDHPSRAITVYAAWPVYYGECDDCGQLWSSNTPTKRYCSKRCMVRVQRRVRRAREFGEGDSFRWTEVIKLFIAFDRACAYCHTPIEGQPDPDHVVPLSRGGHNTISNILPACRPCNTDKCDRSLDEWAEWRHQRGKPPVTTTFPVGDKRYTHLALRRCLPRAVHHAA